MIDYTVKTKQLDSHPDLEKIVLKHANNIFQRPVLAAQQKIFDEINQKVIASNKPITTTQAIEKDLRLQELTASIDALTGGTFSDAINHSDPGGRNR